METPSVPNHGLAVPAASGEAPHAPGGDTLKRRRRRRFVGGAVFVGLAGLVVAVFFLPLPTYAYKPGSARPTQHNVSIENARTFDTDDGIYFTTVSVGEAVPMDLIRSRFDDNVKILTKEEIYGDSTPDESRAQAREQMESSKLTASYVALGRTGHDVSLTGTGALVLQVLPDGPSEGTLVVGDVIEKVNGTAIATADDVHEALDGMTPGKSVSLVVRTAADESMTEDRSVTLGEHPDRPGQPLLGVLLTTQDLALDSDVGIELDSGRVSGPSAGLAWTLAVIDLLTPGDLDGGRPTAVTGEMHFDGSVGAIGGIEQKLVTVQQEGIDRFLYPAATPEDEVRQLEAHADGVELIPVGSIDDAIEALSPGGLTGYSPAST